jgi:hypothetical protein
LSREDYLELKRLKEKLSKDSRGSKSRSLKLEDLKKLNVLYKT